MTTSLAQRIPCRYVVAKYLGDEIRGEPINIGIIIQSQKDKKSLSKFITNYHRIRTGGEDVSILKQILEKIYQEISESSEKDILDKIPSKYNGKIRFTEPRGTLAENMTNELSSLFERYISIERQVEKIEKITLPLIRKRVWHYLEKDFKGYAKRNKFIEGKRSSFKYDFVLGKKNRIFHSISYDSNDSLKKTKLLDWNVWDAIEKNGLTIDNFGAIISEPNPDNPKYDKMKELYKEGSHILESKNYHLITFDETEEWKKGISKLI